MVKFKPLVFPLVADVTLSAHGYRTVKEIPEIGVRKIAVQYGNELDAAASLRNNPLVQYAEPNYLERLFWIPNDTYYSGSQWNLRKINMESAWNITQGASNVKVAIVDTGLDLDNLDGPVNIVSPLNQCNGTSQVYDTDGHGSHVTGVVAANANNAKGVAGVAPGVSIMPIKVECSGSILVSDTAVGVRYAADNGAKVINYSLGSTNDSQTRREAVDYALSRGVLFVAAAGNEYAEGNPVDYPAAYPGVVAVAATTYNDTHASYSQVQSYVSVSAPGGDPSSSSDPDLTHWITSLDQVHVQGLLSIASLAGTSQAAPHVSGLAGLVWSANPNLTNVQVTNIITSTAVDLGTTGKDDYYGWGRIDAYAALLKAQQSLTPTATPTNTPTLTPTATLVATSIPSPTATVVATATPTSDPSSHVYLPFLPRSWNSVPTATQAPAPSSTATATPMVSPTVTRTPSPSPAPTATPTTAPALQKIESPTVGLVMGYDKAVLVRGLEHDAYLVQYGVGCISLSLYEGRYVFLIYPSVYPYGAKIVITETDQECYILDSAYLGDWDTRITGNWVSKVTLSGQFVTLQDNSVWLVGALDRIHTMLWLPVDNVVLFPTQSGAHIVLNKRTGEAVLAALVE